MYFRKNKIKDIYKKIVYLFKKIITAKKDLNCFFQIKKKIK